jgi:hypothetical protein
VHYQCRTWPNSLKITKDPASGASNGLAIMVGAKRERSAAPMRCGAHYDTRCRGINGSDLAIKGYLRKPMLLAKNGPSALIRHRGNRDAMQPGAPDITPRKTLEEFRARQRARYAAADPEYRERWLARQRERRRYATDPVYREQLLKRQRERYANDPEYRQQIVEREQKRYARKMKGSNL